jgi:hypothetical protein
MCVLENRLGQVKPAEIPPNMHRTCGRPRHDGGLRKTCLPFDCHNLIALRDSKPCKLAHDNPKPPWNHPQYPSPVGEARTEDPKVIQPLVLLLVAKTMHAPPNSQFSGKPIQGALKKSWSIFVYTPPTAASSFTLTTNLMLMVIAPWPKTRYQFAKSLQSMSLQAIPNMQTIMLKILKDFETL